MGPGFSERTFEFCFNAEYCRRNAALLATHPHIPSQSAEKALGYDVEFKINQGRYTRSIFIQHKVSSFAQYRSGKGAPFWDARHGPYYRFSVDNDQHNTLCDLSRRKGNVFYCAPSFHFQPDLERHFRANSIGINSTLFDPMDVGDITDTLRHNVTYDPAGGSPILHSDPRKFERNYSGGDDNPPPLEQGSVDAEYVADLAERLIARTERIRLRGSLEVSIRNRRPVEAAQIILGKIYKVSWILLQ